MDVLLYLLLVYKKLEDFICVFDPCLFMINIDRFGTLFDPWGFSL